MKADTSVTTALSGGTDTGITLALDANRRIVIDLPPLVLTAGVTLGVNIPIVAAASRSFFTVLFFEE